MDSIQILQVYDSPLHLQGSCMALLHYLTELLHPYTTVMHGVQILLYWAVAPGLRSYLLRHMREADHCI